MNPHANLPETEAATGGNRPAGRAGAAAVSALRRRA
jgi:hypothetical protein